MKRLIYILSAITVLLMSCTPEILPDTGMGDNCIKLTVNSSVMKTRSIDDPNGNTNERVIKRLDCFFYSKGNTDKNCIHYERITGLNAIATAEIPVYVNEDLLNTIFPSQTTCDVYVIANLPDGIDIPANTDTTSLGNILITSNEFSEAVKADYSLSKPSSFVMKGAGIATRDADNVTGNIPLHRVASKITVNVYLPKQIVATVNDTNGNFVRNETWIPYFDNPTDPTAGVSHVLAGFHNGTKKDRISGSYTVQNEDYFETPKTNKFTYKSTLPADTDKAGDVDKYLYKCEAEFYTYSSEWNQGDPEASYLTLVIPWKKEGEDVYQTFYYQVLVNAGTRKFEPNRWYDLTLNVGVLGSTVEAKPVEIEATSYHILDWSTLENSNDEHLDEEVEIFDWQYLIVHQNRIEMNNTTVGELTFDASHPIGWKLEWPTDTDIIDGFIEQDALEEYNKNTKDPAPAYYINCGGTSPLPKELSSINNNCFKLSSNKLTFTYPAESLKEQNIYSPVYVHLTIWLNIDGNNTNEPDKDTNEEKFVEYITFVYYPSMYIIPDMSHPYSIYVNARQTGSATSSGNDITYTTNRQHNLGRAPGHSGDTWNGSQSYMYTISVSSFKSTDTFKWHDGKDYQYIIGDPRVRTSDIEMDDDGNLSNMSANWRTADKIQKDATGNITYINGKLEHYYPTASDEDSFQIVSPKFRIVSFHSSGWGNITSKGAEMRCATFQEDGYPAGRWRLPTAAEVMFVINLQKADVISDIFYGTSRYYCATEIDATHRYSINYNNGNISYVDNQTTGSVRCVYDEWYWGDKREAKKNPNWKGSHETFGDNEYLPTWGDKEIIW